MPPKLAADPRKDAVIVAKPVGGLLARVAASQLPGAISTTDELVVGTATADDAVQLALDVRRWSGSLQPDQEVKVAIVGTTVEGQGGDAIEAGRQLLEDAKDGEVVADLGIPDRLDLSWLKLRKRKGARVVSWSGGRAAAGESSTSSPPRDRPWPMFDRTDELGQLAMGWREAVAGERRVVMVAGSPGYGKTRLVAEAAREVARAGGNVLYGSAGERPGAPYAPFIQALGRTLNNDGAPNDFASLARGLGIPENPPSAGIGNERSVLFSAATSDLERRCEEAPTALVIDDVHACDPSSLALLHHLATAADLTGLLIVATYRPTDLAPDSEETKVLADLRADAATTHLELGPLNRTSLAGIATSFETPSEAIDEIIDVTEIETGGLPLYACELLRSLSVDGPTAGKSSKLPRTLKLLISSRAHALGERTRGHLEAAAVAGQSFDAGVVGRACGESAREFGASMNAAERAGLIALSERPNCYEFEHALTMRCLYEELNHARRSGLHRALAIALEAAAEAGNGVEPGQLAFHWERTDPPDERKAAAYAMRAAEMAQRRFDPAAAVEWYERALELGQNGQIEHGAEHCDLLIGFGAALRQAGNPRFRDTLLEAARLAVELDDTDRLVAAVLTNDRGFISAIGEFDRDRLAMIELAAERVQSSADRALVLAQLALELTFAPERERRHETAAEALALARSQDDQRLLARVLNRHLISRWEPGNARERIRTASESIEVSSRLGDSLDLFHGLHWRAAAQLEAGEIDGAMRSFQDETRVAMRLGDPTASWLAKTVESVKLALAGKLAEAEEAATAASQLGLESSQPDTLPVFASQIASIRWQQGRLHELAPLLDMALEQNPGLPAFRSLVALARVAAGDPDGAREIVAIDSVDGFERLPRDPTWLAATATYAHAVADVAELGAAETLFNLLEPMRGRVSTSSVSVWGLVDHALGRLASILGMDDTAITYLERSVLEYQRFSAPVWRGQAMVDLAVAMRRARRDPQRQAVLVDEARGVALRYDAKLLMRELPAPPRDQAAKAGSAAPRAGSSTSERLGTLDLTDRQRDVVALVVRGLSNKEVAEELEISPKTVKRHLEEAFNRTGVHGRKGLMALLHG